MWCMDGLLGLARTSELVTDAARGSDTVMLDVKAPPREADIFIMGAAGKAMTGGTLAAAAEVASIGVAGHGGRVEEVVR